MYINILIFFGVVIGYIFFIKLLKLFRDSRYIDLVLIFNQIINIINQNNINYFYLIILIFSYIILVRTIRNYILYEFKKSFLTLHYYLLVRHNFYKKLIPRLHLLPQNIFYFFFPLNFKHRVDLYNGLQWFFRYICSVILILCFIYDIIFNNFILVMVSKFLPWFGIYYLIYWIIIFFNVKIIYDYVIEAKSIHLDYTVGCIMYARFLHNQKLLFEYSVLKEKDLNPNGFLIYKNLSINYWGDKPRSVPKEWELHFNGYIYYLLD